MSLHQFKNTSRLQEFFRAVSEEPDADAMRKKGVGRFGKFNQETLSFSHPRFFLGLKPCHG
jgi:hypothetical protein